MVSRLRGAGGAVAEAATPVLSGAVISGPASASIARCTSFKVTAIGQYGYPFTVAQNEPVLLRLFSAASVWFSANSSCSSPQKQFTIKAGTSAHTFYALDSAAESFLVQPVINPSSSKPIYGTDFTMNFTGVQATPTPTPVRTPTPSPSPTPSGLKLTDIGCWYTTSGNRYQALNFQLASPATLILQGELYTGSNCVPANFSDQLNDFGTPESFGTLGYIFWFINRANLTDVSVVWSFSDTSNNLLWSSSCVEYSTAPAC